MPSILEPDNPLFAFYQSKLHLPVERLRMRELRRKITLGLNSDWPGEVDKEYRICRRPEN
jgi:hypothetical protein